VNDDPLKLTRDAIDEYNTGFRRADFPALEISGLYDLFPSKPHSLAKPAEHNWPVRYPSDQRAGVYLIYSDTFELLYVGKASMGSCLGKRLYTYFGAAQECVLKHTTWTQSPRFMLTIAVPESMPFEAPALEEFLIGRLEPTNNSVGR
jgi:hypothetical protein